MNGDLKSNPSAENRTSIASFRMSDTLVSITSVVYIIFLTVLSVTFLVITIISNLKEESEIYAIVLMAISVGYLSFLTYDIYSYLKNNKDISNTDQNLRYAFLYGHNSDFFYLKIGATWFMLGIILHSIMLLMYEVVFFDSEECGSFISLVFELLFPIYSLILLLFAYKFSNVVIRSNVLVARFAIMHCIGTSIMLWVYKIMAETKESLLGHYYFKSVDSNCTTPASLDGVYKNLTPFLYPFIIEFYVLNAGLLYMLWSRIGTKCDNLNVKQTHIVSADLSRSMLGFISGLILLIVMIGFIIVSFAVDTEKDYLNVGLTPAGIFDLLFLIICTAVLIAAFIQTSKLSILSHSNSRFDDILLFIGIPGVLAQKVFEIFPSILAGNVQDIFRPIVEIVQVFVQTAFIITRMRLCSDTEELVKYKPGRQMILFLFIANIALWVYYTFSVKMIDSYEHEVHFYGETLWSILHHVTLPFVMFYRFHSSVCLIHIWKHSYAALH